jgi:rhamnogalacturonyl hydrolase YesR
MRARRLVLVVLLLLTAALPLPAAKRRAVGSSAKPASPYLDVARQTAAWLMSIERVQGDRISWPMSMAAPSTHLTGIDVGAAGVGFFFLRMHQVTREEQYLARARGAANFVAGAYAGSGITSHDWLNGRAGGGAFLLAVWRETGEQRYLDAARAAGDWLLADAVAQNGGLFWDFPNVNNTYTGLAHGAAGVGVFLVDLHAATNEPKYLDAAKKAWTWISGFSLPLGEDGVGWKRLTRDIVPYPGWCGGATGIVYFLDKLYAATDDTTYRDALVRTANGLVNSARPKPEDSAAWDHYGPNSGHGIAYCHGATSVMGALSVAFERTGDARYLDMARKAERWVGGRAVAEEAGMSWFHFDGSRYHETGLLTGTASVGHAYLRLWRIDPNPAHLARVRAAAAWLSFIANHPAPGQARWINYTQPDQPGDDPQTYHSGWYVGAAGIGLFFLELHQTTSGVPVSNDFSGVHP